MQKKATALSLALPILCLALPGCKQEKPSRGATEKLLSKIDVRRLHGAGKISPDARHLAQAATIRRRPARKGAMVLDGKEGKQYDSVGYPTFSPDSKKLAYVARLGKKSFVVVDGKEGTQYDRTESSPIFSPDSKRLAYAARQDNKSFVVVDRKEGRKHRRLIPRESLANTLLFSPDSKHVAYLAQLRVPDGREERTRTVVVAYGRVFGPYYRIGMGSPVFSPDGNWLAYNAIADGKSLLIMVSEDGRQHVWGQTPDDSVPVFSPDSRRLAYVGRQGVVVDGKQGKQYDGIYGKTLTFSLNSKRVAYAARVGKKSFVVVDGKEGRQYDTIRRGTPLFSPDSNRVAYVAALGKKQLVVVDGKEEKHYDRIVEETLLFSRDSSRVAYAAWEPPLLKSKKGYATSKEFVVVDGRKGKEHTGIKRGSLTFTPDSRRLAYIAKTGSGAERVVVMDGKTSRAYVDILSDIVFDSPDTFHYIALENRRWYLVEETIE